VSIIDRKRAPVPQAEPRAQLPAREEREGILARARAAVAGKTVTPATPQRAQPVTPRPGLSGEARSAKPDVSSSQSSQPAPQNLPAVVKHQRGAVARQPARSAFAAARRGEPARQGQPAAAAPVPAAQNRMEVQPGQGTTAVQNGGNGQTIIVQVSAPQPVYPWWGGPWWWGYSGAGCSSRSCPLRVGQPCKRWLCGW
jgi:hypothetical protein